MGSGPPVSRGSRARNPVLASFLMLLFFGSSLVIFGAPAAHAGTASGVGGPAYQASAPVAGTKVNLVTSFEGLRWGYNGNQFDSWSPPDPQVAAGPTEVVEMVNLHEEIFDKTGASLGVIPLPTVFQSSSDYIGDPRILYDNSSGRFFASVFDWTQQTVLVAVSSSSTADSGWFVVSLSTPKVAGQCPDQPYIGTSNDKVVVTANDYVATGPANDPCSSRGSFSYQIIWYVDKGAMLSAGNTNWWYYYYDFSVYDYFGFRPVTSPTETAYVVCTTCGNGLIVVKEANGAVTSTTPPTITTVNVPFATPPPPPPAPHLGNTDLIDTNDEVELQSSFWSSSGIWLTMNDGCVPAGDNAQRSCVRLAELSVATNSVTVSQDLSGPVGYYLFFSAVTMDSFGGLGIVTGYASSSTYPSLAITGVNSGEPLSDLETNLVTAANGTGYDCHFVRYSGLCRYGDYFGASPDPADRSTMWFVGEYETPNGWATEVAAVRVGIAAITLSYSTQDGSTVPSAPTMSYTLHGTPQTAQLSKTPTVFYADLGSTWGVAMQAGGTTTERWTSTGTVGGQVTGDLTQVVSYYHQYSVTPSFSVVGGGTGYGTPSITCASLGASVAATAGTAIWVDAGSTCTFSQTLTGGSSDERWVSSSSGVQVQSPGQASLSYQHQYYVTTSRSPTGGGSVSNTTGWYDSGATVALSATAYQGWQFEGWSGTGAGSYTGGSASTTFALNGPVNETATFYPGLTVAVTGGGSVQYSVGGVQRAINGSGGTVYEPLGTSITLTASASSFLYTFDGWGGGSSGQVVLNGPTSVTASFGINYVAVAGLVGVVVVAIAGAAFFLRRRGGGGVPYPPPPPPD